MRRTLTRTLSLSALAGALLLGTTGCFADLSSAPSAACDPLADALARTQEASFSFAEASDGARSRVQTELSAALLAASAAEPLPQSAPDSGTLVPVSALEALAPALAGSDFDPAAPEWEGPMTAIDEWLISVCELPSLSSVFAPPMTAGGSALSDAPPGSAQERIMDAARAAHPNASWMTRRASVTTFSAGGIERVRVFLAEPASIEDARTVCQGILSVLPAQPDLADPLVIVYSRSGEAAAASLADSCLATGDTVPAEE